MFDYSQYTYAYIFFILNFHESFSSIDLTMELRARIYNKYIFSMDQISKNPTENMNLKYFSTVFFLLEYLNLQLVSVES